MNKRLFLLIAGVLSAPFLLGDTSVEEMQSESTDQMQSQQSAQQPMQNCSPPTYLMDRNNRVTFKHREANGIGYPTGYSSIEGFFSTSKTPTLLGFADVRAHIFNDSKKAYNLGVGFRSLSEPLHAVFGANVFYDYRDGLHRAFNQIGVGLEVLTRKWDLRANGYIPVHNTKKKYRDEFLKFKANSAIFAKRYEFAFVGCELALGRELVKRKYWDLHAKLAGYWFNGDYGKNAGGGLFELSTNITRYLTLKGQASYDTLFRGVFQAEAAINVPFGNLFGSMDSTLSCTALKELEDRLVETVDRFEIIVTSTKRKKAPAIDPLTGQPLKFIFVNNTSHSLGTFESPFPTLAQAQAASVPDDVIYVFPGDGSANGMNSGITLQNNQKLIGSAATVTVTTAFGVRTIPAQTLSAPVITNAGDTVTLANNNTVSGFNILSTTGRGIIGGANTIGAFITQNHIVTTNNAINLPSFSGTVVIDNNLLAATGANNAGVLLSSSNAFDITVTGNFIFANSGNTINLNVGAGSNGSALIAFNGINIDPPSPGPQPIAMAATGLQVLVGVGGATPASLTGVITGNQIMNPGLGGMILSSAAAGSFNLTVSKNIIENAGTNGIFIEPGNGTSGSSFINLIDNVIPNASFIIAGNNGIAIETTLGNVASLQARLAGNSCSAVNSFGYFLQSSGGQVSVETPDVANPQAGLQAINIGTFNPASFVDAVTFIPFVP